MNPNGVEIVRVYTRETGGTVADITPGVPSQGGSFQVVVEAEAGAVIAGSGAPYKIAIEAFDYSTGEKAQPALKFSQSVAGAFGSGWPNHQEVFTITLNANEAPGVQDHILRYVAYLVTPPPRQRPQIVSFAESPLFMITGER